MSKIDCFGDSFPTFVSKLRSTEGNESLKEANSDEDIEKIHKIILDDCKMRFIKVTGFMKI